MITDTDWARDIVSRKSTSGGCLLLGSHLIKHWSKQQSVIALSSAEAELYGMCPGGSEALGLRSSLRDFGKDAKNVLHTDSSAAMGICTRQGLGKVRHICVQDLWLQQSVAGGHICLAKIPGELNPADLLTKPSTYGNVERLLKSMSLYFESGRPGIAPKLL